MDVPTIEHPRDASGSSDGSTQAQQTDAATLDGPTVTFAHSDGTETVLTYEHLRLYLLAIQTFLLLYVTYLEVSR